MLITGIQEQKSLKEKVVGESLLEHGEFKTSGTVRSSEVGNSICGLPVEKFRQFAFLYASRAFTVNFPPEISADIHELLAGGRCSEIHGLLSQLTALWEVRGRVDGSRLKTI